VDSKKKADAETRVGGRSGSIDRRRLALEHNSSNTREPLFPVVALTHACLVRAGHEQHQPLSIALFLVDV
jgi:hypothetical protein